MDSTTGQEALDRELAAVAEGVERWRRQRTKHGPMPADLWQAAVGLAETRGTGAVARALRINHAALQKRRPKRVSLAPPGAPGEKPRFVELGASLFASAAPANQVIEFFGADGARLKVSLSADQDLSILQLADRFWSRRR